MLFSQKHDSKIGIHEYQSCAQIAKNMGSSFGAPARSAISLITLVFGIRGFLGLMLFTLVSRQYEPGSGAPFTP
jgi:hypothetical protein